MKILSIDTSTDYMSLAVMDGEKVLRRFHRKADRNHARLLIPTIESLLKRSRIKLDELDAFCIGVGPGSFTGLRIGVTTIKGLSLATGKPIAAVPTLDAIAYNARNEDAVICPVLDARKKKVYACLYRFIDGKLKRLTKYLLLPAEELVKIAGEYDKVFFLGDALHIIGKHTDEKIDWHPRADVLGNMGLEFINKKRCVTPEKLEPMYLYSKECDITGK
ncbi:MAG: tRNA (adenosine(37)-N6)-threonylcarbamoyltransferase complex dimerization subunit type 1 TsaB [Candidatus Omnitrophota bacterium]|jgi:tRNA threonylcarbamoyl adenosine modification protein YeaZ